MTTSATGGYLLPTTPFPIDDELLSRRLSNVVSGVTGLPGNMVRPRWQENPPPIPAPDQDWAAVGVTMYPTSAGTPEIRHVSDSDGHSLLSVFSEVRVLASFYGPSCSSRARLCQVAVWIDQNWEQLKPLGLRVANVGDVTITAEEVDETWYRRADLPVTLVQDASHIYSILNVLSAHGVTHAGRPGTSETVDVPFNSENVVDSLGESSP